jgi:sterol 3beta-glucosyltransferase
MDGVAGFVTEPYKGAKEDGGMGFAVGLAKGTMGLFTKPGAGTCDSTYLPLPIVRHLD